MTPDTQCLTCVNREKIHGRPACSVFGDIPTEFMSNDEECPAREERPDADEGDEG